MSPAVGMTILIGNDSEGYKKYNFDLDCFAQLIEFSACVPCRGKDALKKVGKMVDII